MGLSDYEIKGEPDWRRDARRQMDLTFRSLLILHYSGCSGYIPLE